MIKTDLSTPAVIIAQKESSSNFAAPQKLSFDSYPKHSNLFSEVNGANLSDSEDIFGDFNTPSSTKLKITELQLKIAENIEIINREPDFICILHETFAEESLINNLNDLELPNNESNKLPMFEQAALNNEDLVKSQTDNIEKYSELQNEEYKDEINQENPPLPVIMFREPSINDEEPPESQNSYFQELSMFRVQMTEWSDLNLSNYIYSGRNISPQSLNRVTKEINAMTKSLPCEPSGAIFLAVDSTNLGRMKVLLSGAEDTPYEHGLYLFDIHLSESYPNTPPEMTIKTTGNGSFRFNPNLYNTGFVCLSIINTWDGYPEEMWNSSFSTIMQVLLSIQSLVMTSDIIQKEPWFEHLTTQSAENQAYSTIVKYGNVTYAILEMLKNPPIEFKDVVFKHFALKKEKILQTVEKWISELPDITTGLENRIVSTHNCYAYNLIKKTPLNTLFLDLFEQLKTELSTLP